MRAATATSASEVRATPEIIAALSPLLPKERLLWQREQLLPYECDGLTMYRRIPLAVALPETEAEVIALLKACTRLGIPVVARGAGTGLSGGAMPHAQGLLMGLSRLNKIKAIDALARTATVEPGVRNLAISEAAAPHGLYYAPDPSSQIACTIGGNVAENSGGVHCLKYGLTVNNVCRVRCVMMDGDVVELGSNAPDVGGLDLLALLVGSEGMLAIVTEVTVRLIPRPPLARVVMASFDDVEKAGDAVARIIGAGIIPAGLEMMDQAATRAVEPFVKAGYDLDAKAILLAESDGTPEEVDDEIRRMEAVMAAAGATRCQVSVTEQERLLFWAGRKNAFPAAGRVSPDYYCMDGTIPRRQVGKVLNAIARMEMVYRLRCMNVFHAGDGNLHPLILFDANDADELARADAFGAEILELCITVGGTVTGEHGVGYEKINQMCSQFARCELDAFLAVKYAFDPAGLLNPEKVIPTLHRCAEYGKLKVHAGQVPHAELERF